MTRDPGLPLAIAWALAAIAAVIVHRGATSRRTRFGEAPGGIAPIAWAVLVLVFGVLGLLLYGVAVLGQDRRRRSGG